MAGVDDGAVKLSENIRLRKFSKCKYTRKGATYLERSCIS